MKDWKSAAILSAAVIVTALLICFTFFNRNKAEDTIAVTGYGKMDFRSDRVSWRGEFAEQGVTAEQAYANLETSKRRVVEYLGSQRVMNSELTWEPVELKKLYNEKRNDRGELLFKTQIGYELTQTFKLDSADVDKIEQVSRGITSLISAGVEIVSQKPEYFYTGLSELKQQLIALATDDARNRAQQIAVHTGANLGKLRASSLGIFQIIGMNTAVEADWSGSFDTASKFKTASITVKAQFEIK